MAPDVATKAYTQADRYFRRNFFLLLTEYSMRHVAGAFIDPTIILPVFVSQLTDSPLLIGLNGSLPFTMWLFPQLFAARYLSGKTQKKRYVLLPMLVNRPVCFVLALAAIISAFALLAVGLPEPNIELHRARLGEDEEYRELMEEDLRRRKRQRVVLISTLFACGACFTVTGFLVMRPG